MKLVSIVVRTCGRPHILKETLESIRKQNYKNIEIVIQEDGQATAKELIDEVFQDLNIQYEANGVRLGRTQTGNRGLERANGEYLMFLDDDDIIYPEHVEVLVRELENGKELAAYAIAHESIVKYNKRKKAYIETKRWIRYKQPFNRLFLTYNNYIPIQSILFRRELYEELGGFDETLDYLEDWDLWVRYSTKTDFIFVDKVTSLYRVPKKKKKRDINMREAYENVSRKFQAYSFHENLYLINKEMCYIMNEIKTSRLKRKLILMRNHLQNRR